MPRSTAARLSLCAVAVFVLAVAAGAGSRWRDLTGQAVLPEADGYCCANPYPGLESESADVCTQMTQAECLAEGSGAMFTEGTDERSENLCSYVICQAKGFCCVAGAEGGTCSSFTQAECTAAAGMWYAADEDQCTASAAQNCADVKADVPETCGDGEWQEGEQCDGQACCTPECTLVKEGTVCRKNDDWFAETVCDPSEACNGTSPFCPTDVFYPGKMELHCKEYPGSSMFVRGGKEIQGRYLSPSKLAAAGVEMTPSLKCGTCQYDNLCPDGTVFTNPDEGDDFAEEEDAPAYYEDCDDANYNNTDICVNCSAARCGDGYVLAAQSENDKGEECDDGDDDNTNDCTNFCKQNICGDGFVNKGVETCDDGNTVSGDGCGSDQGDATIPGDNPYAYFCMHEEKGFTCTIAEEGENKGKSICTPICGDGLVVKGEQCDNFMHCQNKSEKTCVTAFDCPREMIEVEEEEITYREQFSVCVFPPLPAVTPTPATNDAAAQVLREQGQRTGTCQNNAEETCTTNRDCPAEPLEIRKKVRVTRLEKDAEVPPGRCAPVSNYGCFGVCTGKNCKQTTLCQQMPGFVCPQNSAGPCAPICGDGIEGKNLVLVVDGAQTLINECDDGKHCADADHTSCTQDAQCATLFDEDPEAFPEGADEQCLQRECTAVKYCDDKVTACSTAADCPLVKVSLLSWLRNPFSPARKPATCQAVCDRCPNDCGLPVRKL